MNSKYVLKYLENFPEAMCKIYGIMRDYVLFGENLKYVIRDDVQHIFLTPVRCEVCILSWQVE